MGVDSNANSYGSNGDVERSQQPAMPGDSYQHRNHYGAIGTANNMFILPFYRQPHMPPGAAEVPIIGTLLPEACGTKIITGGVMGAIIGIGLGAFMGAMGDVSPIQVLNGREVPVAPLREQMRGAFKSTAAKTGGWAKSFGILTALFGGVECVVEKYRAKHDVWNPVISGCVVGATLSAKAGPAVSNEIPWQTSTIHCINDNHPLQLILRLGILHWLRWVRRIFSGS